MRWGRCAVPEKKEDNVEQRLKVGMGRRVKKLKKLRRRMRLWGVGEVVAVSSQAIDVEFPDGSKRSFHPEFVRAWRAPGRGARAAAQARSALAE